MTMSMRLFGVLAIAGLAVVMLAQAAFAKDQGGTRPGWGYGDKNHVHTGPPGQSVRPDNSGPGSVNSNKGSNKGPSANAGNANQGKGNAKNK